MGLRNAVLSMTVDRPTRIEPVYELELAEVVADESTELLLPAVGETTIAGTTPVLDWLDAVSVELGRTAKTVAERDDIDAENEREENEREESDACVGVLLGLASYGVGWTMEAGEPPIDPP